MSATDNEKRVIETILALPNQFPDGALDSAWTKAIKLALGHLGVSLGYSVCTAGIRAHFDGAWLYDLCWYICTPEDQFMEMPLALESEWKRDYRSIKDDFEKLLVAKSNLKVMIFQASGARATSYLNRLEAGIRVFKGGCSGEVYLLACFDEATWKFEIRRIEIA